MSFIKQQARSLATKAGSSTRAEPVMVYTRRTTVLRSAVAPLLLNPLLDALVEQSPDVGNCPTCIGAVDGSLGSCAGLNACVSSFDDRPSHFAAPWEYEAASASSAQAQLERAIVQLGGRVAASQPLYVHATFTDGSGSTDDVEFLLAEGDDTVAVRSASRRRSLPDAGRNARRLEALRVALSWQQVPVLRNRQLLFGLFETPWDAFGPVAPLEPDYSKLEVDGP